LDYFPNNFPRPEAHVFPSLLLGRDGEIMIIKCVRIADKVKEKNSIEASS